jgi:hypothetical protein
MGDTEDFKAENFTMYTEAKNVAKVQFMDDNQEIPYTAKCFLNAKKTIGYAEVDIKEKHETIFLSKTAKGIVMTMTADKEGPLPMNAEGIHVIYGVPIDTPQEAMFGMHMKALGGETPLEDEPWLKEHVPELPQKSLDVAMMIMNQIFSSFGGAEGLMEALGDAMTGAMEGIGKGMAEAMQGIGNAMVPEPEAPTEGEPKAAPKRPAKKAAPKKAAPNKAAKPAKKKAPSKAKPKAKSGKKKR